MLRKRLHIKVSKFCNNNCIFCLDDRPKRKDTDINEVTELLSKHRNLGEMLFTCGEPTLHSELPEFILLAKKFGYRSIGLVTNGRRLSYGSYCDLLIHSGLNEITISIHGCNERMHDSLTRTKKSFEQTVKALYNVGERKKFYDLHLITSTVITRRNLESVYDILKFLRSFNVDTMVLNVVEPSGEALKNFDRLTPPYKEISKALNYAIKNFPDKDRIVVEGIPLCLCLDFLECTGVREEIHLKEGEKIKVLPPGRFHIKVNKCRDCKLTSRCPGIFEKYASRRGVSELKCIKTIQPLRNR